MSLKEYFPYSQVFHALAARITKDHRFLEQKAALQLAAIYAADRAVLKQVMSDEALPVGKSLPPYIQIIPSEPTASEHFNDDHGVVTFGENGTGEPLPHQDGGFDGAVADVAADLTQARQSDAGTLNFQQRAQQLHAETAASAETPATETDAPDHHASDTQGVAHLNGSIALEDQANPVADVLSVPDAPANQELATDTEVRIDPVAKEAGEVTVADQVINDLERLNQLKHNFEALFEANKASILLRDAAKAVGATPEEELNRIQQARQKRIAELVSSLDPELTATEQTLEMEYGAGSKNILEEIRNNKQELEPENEKQKDQLRMIDDFIKTQPVLAGKDKAAAPEDLSTIKTGEFSDNVVSETLVDILLKQGKKEKAVEVLKKLIWKFPQKKAYFAAQIEDLKK